MNRFYDTGLDAFATGDIDWINDNIGVAVISDGYAPDTEVDQFMPAIDPSDIIVSASITGRTTDGRGVMDGNSVALPPVTSLLTGQYLVIYKDTGVPSASPLIALIDDMQGLPILFSGQPVTIVWDDGPNKILTLVDRE